MMQGGGGSSMMMTSSFGGGGGGSFSSQTMMMTSSKGSDGQMHTEKYSSSSVGDHGRGIREQQQAYSNSSTGIDKMSLERQIWDQGRKMVKERNRITQEERSTEMFKGLEEGQAHEFDARWGREAAPYVPRHNQMSIGACTPSVRLKQALDNVAHGAPCSTSMTRLSPSSGCPTPTLTLAE